jgi:hypothetical protein
MLRYVPMHRIPLTLRALVLIPLFALGVDHARASIACGPEAESCLQAAGHGWLGAAGVALLLFYAAGLAATIGRIAARRAPGVLPLWLLATVGVAAMCGGQALLAGALGHGAALGGGWLELLAFCAVAGGALALALRVAPAAVALVHSLRHARGCPPQPPGASPRRCRAGRACCWRRRRRAAGLRRWADDPPPVRARRRIRQARQPMPSVYRRNRRCPSNPP